MLPAIVLMQAEVDLHERSPFRPLGFADEMHSGLLRCAVRFARVALDAGANDVLPCGRTAAVTRDDVIQVQIFTLKNLAAVLAHVLIAFKNVVAREFDFLFRHPIENHQQDDARDPDAE